MNTFPKKYPYLCYLKSDTRYLLMITRNFPLNRNLVFGYYFMSSRDSFFINSSSRDSLIDGREFTALYDDIILI